MHALPHARKDALAAGAVDERRLPVAKDLRRILLERKRARRRRFGLGAEDADFRRELPDFLDRKVEGMDDGVDLLLANTPRDELRVLRSEVEDEDGFRLHHGRSAGVPQRAA